MSFQDDLKSFFETLGLSFVGTLATSYHGRVTARTISFVVDNTSFFFQTGKDTIKTHQMLKNNRVAISCGAIQIEGTAVLRGRPQSNSRFIELYKVEFPLAYKMYSSLEVEVLYEVIPALMKVWKYEEGIPFLYIVDFKKKRTTKIRVESN